MRIFVSVIALAALSACTATERTAPIPAPPPPSAVLPKTAAAFSGPVEGTTLAQEKALSASSASREREDGLIDCMVIDKTF